MAIKKTQQKWLPFIEVQCSDGRVRVYESAKTPYCGHKAAMKVARVMRDEHIAIGGDVIITGIERVKE